MKIKKNDLVIVLSGKDKGKKGKVLKAMPTEGKVLVDDVNVVKRHKRPDRVSKQGGIVEQPAAMIASKVMVVCPSCGKPTRIGYKVLEDGKKVRHCKKCGEIIDRV